MREPEMTADPPVLGIDPGLNRTGYAVVRREAGRAVLIEGGLIRTDRSRPLADRLRELSEGLREVLADFSPGFIAVEQAFANGRNFRSSLLLAHARGALMATAAECGVPVIGLAPTEVKRLLSGSGRASKEQVQAAVKAEFRLAAALEPNDVADAAAIALCVLHRRRIAA